jgi:hypothetical protein
VAVVVRLMQILTHFALLDAVVLKIFGQPQKEMFMVLLRVRVEDRVLAAI